MSENLDGKNQERTEVVKSMQFAPSKPKMIKDGSPGLSHDFSSNSLNADREEEEEVVTPQVKE